MDFDQLAKSAAATVMRTFSKQEMGTYHGVDSGDIALDPEDGTGVIVDRDVEVVDETHGYTRTAMATFRSGLFSVRTGDWFEVGAESWDVVGKESDDGHLLRLFVRPRA